MTLAETLTAEPPPLRLDQDGTLRVGRTRVTLDIVIGEYDRGSTPEEIASNFDSLQLEEVYGAIRFYLKHREEVEAYLRQREKDAEEIRRKIEALSPTRDLREKLLARKRAMENGDALPGG
jgi:uncharacterized protein (DUF433 family)